jgi:serine/threonine protein kinase
VSITRQVINAVPGLLSKIDYAKADVWAVGAIAYEVFGSRNPFYGESCLYSDTYSREDLPALPNSVSNLFQRLVHALLAVDRRDVSRRKRLFMLLVFFIS